MQGPAQAERALRPLSGLHIVEFAGLAPAPFAAMMLADHGATVVRIERPDWKPAIPPERDILLRGRARIVALDLKTEEGLADARALIREADGLIEGFRPGVMERLRLGPADLHAGNPRLVYGRITGWGQEGPLANAAGHDINYIALAGNLHTYGSADGPPIQPLNAVADFGGGGMLLAFSMLAGLIHARETGKGTVIDCAMVDGAALLAAQTYSLMSAGRWKDERGCNRLDGGNPVYATYQCADGAWVAIGALEPHFFAVLRDRLGLVCQQSDAGLRDELTALFRRHPRAHWCALLEGSDACLTPVLSLADAPLDPHNMARGTFASFHEGWQPAAAPRFRSANDIDEDLT